MYAKTFVDLFCYLCFTFVFIILSCLFLAALWSPAEKWLTSWLSWVWCFLVFFSLSHIVSRVRCGTWLYRSLIFAFFLTFFSVLINNQRLYYSERKRVFTKQVLTFYMNHRDAIGYSLYRLVKIIIRLLFYVIWWSLSQVYMTYNLMLRINNRSSSKLRT